MTESEAMKAGYQYTGMSNSEWDPRWKETKARAEEIKRNYKGADFRIINNRCRSRYGGSETWKEIYGNEIFRKAQYFNQEAEEKYLNEGHKAALENIKKKYEEEIQREMEIYNKHLSDYELLMSHKK